MSMSQFTEFANKNEIVISSLTQIPARPDLGPDNEWSKLSTHWHVVLSNKKTKQMHVLNYSMGCGLVEMRSQVLTDPHDYRKRATVWKSINPSLYLHPNWSKLKYRSEMESLISTPRGVKYKSFMKFRWERPTIETILCSLQLDSGGELCNFEDWADEYGYDPDSRHAYKVWESCVNTRKQMRTFLGEAWSEFQTLEEE